MLVNGDIEDGLHVPVWLERAHPGAWQLLLEFSVKNLRTSARAARIVEEPKSILARDEKTQIPGFSPYEG